MFIRSVDLEGLEKVIVIGGADLDGTGLTSTMLQIKNSLQTYSDVNNLGFTVKAFNTKVDGSTISRRYFLPSHKLSLIKSIDQTSLMASG